MLKSNNVNLSGIWGVVKISIVRIKTELYFPIIAENQQKTFFLA